MCPACRRRRVEQGQGKVICRRTERMRDPKSVRPCPVRQSPGANADCGARSAGRAECARPSLARGPPAPNSANLRRCQLENWIRAAGCKPHAARLRKPEAVPPASRGQRRPLAAEAAAMQRERQWERRSRTARNGFDVDDRDQAPRHSTPVGSAEQGCGQTRPTMVFQEVRHARKPLIV